MKLPTGPRSCAGPECPSARYLYPRLADGQAELPFSGASADFEIRRHLEGGADGVGREGHGSMGKRHHLVTRIIWGFLLISGLGALVVGQWEAAFLALITFGLTLLPFVFQSWSGIFVPNGFVAAIVFFIVATIFLGEVGDFYGRIAWWDTMLHTGSAIGFGIIGTVLVVMMLEGARLAASPPVVALFAFSFAMSVGAVWEIFEFGMDQLFGLNMQKSGCLDTLGGLISNGPGIPGEIR